MYWANRYRFALESDWESAVTCVLVAAFFDLIDGLTARVLKATSKIGAELDSLSDAVSFGVTPTVILYLWVLSIMKAESAYLLGWYWIPFIFIPLVVYLDWQGLTLLTVALPKIPGKK